MTDSAEVSMLVFIAVLLCLLFLIGIIIDAIHRANDYKRDMLVLKRDWLECSDVEERRNIKKEMRRLWLTYLPIIGNWFS